MAEDSRVLSNSEIMKTPHEKHELGIGEISFGPCAYLGPFQFIKTNSGLKGHHDTTYGVHANINFKIGFSYNLGTNDDARDVAFKKVKKLLRGALKKLKEAERITPKS
jgi:hypothetical protein